MQKTTPVHCPEYARIDRRTFLTRGAQSAAAMVFANNLVALPSWMPRLHFADPHVGPRGDTLVCIFLRGGADGLNIVVPHGDDEYYAHRPTIGIARPDDGRADARTLDLDGFFGLHPALAPLHESYGNGHLALVHATGSPDESRSHFEAMDLMERGATENGDYTGWLARHLATLDTGNSSALRAVGVGDMLPAALTGAVSATALQSIAGYHLREEGGADAAELQTVLQNLYAQEEDILAAAANQTFAAIEVLGKINTQGYVADGRGYAETEFAQALRMVAQLIKADVGVEVACVDVGGWDTHVAQGGGSGIMARQLAELGEGLAAFYGDITRELDHVSVVVMSEFGRRLQENAGLGTDHGHGNMMLLLGGGLQGGTVYADWPGLHDDQLVGPGDLAITTDYRDVLGELLAKRLNNPLVDAVFPGYQINEMGLAVRA